MTDILEQDRDFWDRHARRDPLWAILSDPAKTDGKWDVERFLQTGVSEISALLYVLDLRGIVMNHRSALDFGCGVGRLTQALAPHFDRVVGLDISPTMLDGATRLNHFPQNVSYMSNQAADLMVFGDGEFDFIISNIVLQHIRPGFTLQYVREFFRVLTPGGIAVFQLPSHQRGPEDPPPVATARAMPDAAYQASLVVSGIPGGALGAGSEVTLTVDVTNLSAFEWSQQQFGVIRVGDHWLDGAGRRMLLRDDGRTSLPATLRPAETWRALLTIAAPPGKGDYQCEIDLAHEGVVWFHDKGSPVVRFAVRVRLQEEADSAAADEADLSPARRARQVVDASSRLLTDVPPLALANPDGEDPGAFPMYGVPTGTVIGLIASHGATLLHRETDRSCGDDWVSYRYFVRNRA